MATLNASSTASPANIGRVEITGLRFTGEIGLGDDIHSLLAPIRKQARRKNVQSVSATLHFGQELSLPVEVQERGARMRVAQVGLYAFSVDGVLRALGDYIRVVHHGDALMLDAYQHLLESTIT